MGIWVCQWLIFIKYQRLSQLSDHFFLYLGVYCYRMYCHLYWGCQADGCNGCLAKFKGIFSYIAASYSIVIYNRNCILILKRNSMSHMGRAWHYLLFAKTFFSAMVILCGSGTIVGGVFYSARQLSRFSPLNMQYILNLFRISLHGEAINYRPYASPSFEVASHIKNCHFGYIIIIEVIHFSAILTNKLTSSYVWDHFIHKYIQWCFKSNASMIVTSINTFVTRIPKFLIISLAKLLKLNYCWYWHVYFFYYQMK